LNTKKPLVSFILLSYQQEQFIRDAVKSALAQIYHPLEIIISDDCSSDSTYTIIKDEINGYNGPHQIKLNKNETNLGLSGNINKAVSLSSGEYIIMAAGDDISEAIRTERHVAKWMQPGVYVDAVCSYFSEIDVNGRFTGYIKKNVLFVPDITHPVRLWQCGATGACAGYSRKLFKKYGDLDHNILAEDWVLSFRAWAESGIALIEQPLVKHRTHGKCISVMHKNVKLNKNVDTRIELRVKALMDSNARYKDWLNTWRIAKKDDKNVEMQLQESLRTLELEKKAYEVGRIKAFQYALKCLKSRCGSMSACRIIYRRVFGLN
jgi:glycosyltransferase involved in cell wall biosynthesis